MLTEGQTDPTNVSDQTPEFSAIYNNPDSADGAIYYRIQVATSSSYWDSPEWDSGKTGMATTSEGSRSPDISYGSSTPLEFDGSTYYWRIKYWDAVDNEGAWSSSTDSFQMAVSDIEGLQNFTYSYDQVGNIIEIEDDSETNSDKAVEPITIGVEYTYDDLYRLISASTTNTVAAYQYLETYSYNAIGNITNKSDQGNYTYSGAGFLNPHAVSQIAAQSMSYDNNGNLTNDGTWTHSWTYDNRLASSTNGSVNIAYGYDHSGSRVKLDNGSSLFIYPNKYYNIDTDSGTATKHIFSPSGELIATVVTDSLSTTTNYIHTDHLGGSSVITDEEGQAAQVLDYYPFGDIRLNEQEGSFDEQRKFTGHEYDDDTDLNYMIARYQNPAIGRFISVDPAAQNNPTKFLTDPQQLDTPRTTQRLNSTSESAWRKNTPSKDNLTLIQDEYLANPQRQNLYSYCHNNPLSYTDPTGETEFHFTLTTNVGFGGSGAASWSVGIASDGSYGVSRSWHAGGFAGGDASVNVGAGYSSAETWSDTSGNNRYVEVGGKLFFGGGGNINFTEDGVYNGVDISVGAGPSTPIYMGGGLGGTAVVIDRNVKQDMQNVRQGITNVINSTVNSVKEGGQKLINLFTRNK